MIDVVACPGWWLGLSGRVTLSAKVAMCHVNVSRRVTLLARELKRAKNLTPVT